VMDMQIAPLIGIRRYICSVLFIGQALRKPVHLVFTIWRLPSDLIAGRPITGLTVKHVIGLYWRLIGILAAAAGAADRPSSHGRGRA